MKKTDLKPWLKQQWCIPAVSSAFVAAYDVEPIVQVGHFGAHDIRAWTVGTSSGYTFANTPLLPRIGLQFDVVSGDTGHGRGAFGTFNPFYFKAGYFNDASLIRPSNLIDIHPTLQLLHRDNVLMTLGSDVLWRYTTHDGVYGPPGNLALPAKGGSRSVATTAEISAQWQINRHVSWITSYVHFSREITCGRRRAGTSTMWVRGGFYLVSGKADLLRERSRQ